MHRAIKSGHANRSGIYPVNRSGKPCIRGLGISAPRSAHHSGTSINFPNAVREFYVFQPSEETNVIKVTQVRETIADCKSSEQGANLKIALRSIILSGRSFIVR
jgi:hypothetical protein